MAIHFSCFPKTLTSVVGLSLDPLILIYRLDFGGLTNQFDSLSPSLSLSLSLTLPGSLLYTRANKRAFDMHNSAEIEIVLKKIVMIFNVLTILRQFLLPVLKD